MTLHHATIVHASVAHAAGEVCQDAALIVEVGNAVVIVAADGAGGIAESEHASQLVVSRVAQQARRAVDVVDPMPWVKLLDSLDRELFAARGGETTAVVCVVDVDGHCGGASVGDSSAWMWSGSAAPRELTAKQVRKPLVGSGRAVVVPFFVRVASPWTLLAGTDGLFNYVAFNRIAACLRDASDVDALTVRLVDAARLPTGAFADDVAMAIART